MANDVPALAWFLLSSLVPLALGVTALAAVALGDYAEAQALSVRISKVLPKDVQDQLVTLILRTRTITAADRRIDHRDDLGQLGAVGVIERVCCACSPGRAQESCAASSATWRSPRW